ncbi:MAG: G5 domain-containing protein [Armatimonadota bacterium]
MDKDTIIKKLKLQLMIERVVVCSIVLVLIGAWAYGYFNETKAMIVIDGKPVVCVNNDQEAQLIVQEIKLDSGCDPEEIEFRQDIVVSRAPRNANAVSRSKAKRVVGQMLTPMVPRWAILANGKPVVAVSNREMAGEVLEMLKFKYGSLAKNLAEEPQFKENITVDITSVHPSIYKKTAQDAVDFILSKKKTTIEESKYEVQKGDLATTIAAKYKLSLDELKELNKGVNLDRLSIGDMINIKKQAPPKSPITVIVRDRVEVIEKYSPEVHKVSSAKISSGKVQLINEGSQGEKLVTKVDIYENGVKVGTQILNEHILRDASPRQIAIGM